MTQSGIETAQCLNQQHHRVPRTYTEGKGNRLSRLKIGM